MKAGERTFIRHYYIDFGDSLGGRWPFDGISRRLGHSSYFDAPHIFVDTITLGAVPRPWNSVELNNYEIFGYFDAEHFTPSDWHPGYPNPAFDRMTYQDALWAVRILTHFSEDHIRAIVETAKFNDPRYTDWMTDMLLQRRQKIFEEYLTQYSPLASFTIARRGKTADPKAQSICFEDLALYHEVASLESTYYKMRFRGGPELKDELGWLQFTPDPDHPHRSCILLPVGVKRPADLAPKDAPPDHPLRYGVLDIFVHQEPKVPPTSATRLHFYDLGPEKGFRLVGIERPPKPVRPDLY